MKRLLWQLLGVVVVFGALVVAFGGCSSSTNGGSNVTAEQACADVAAARCQKLQSCNPQGIINTYGDLATCQARQSETCVTNLGAPQTANTPARLKSVRRRSRRHLVRTSSSATRRLRASLQSVHEMPGARAPSPASVPPLSASSRRPPAAAPVRRRRGWAPPAPTMAVARAWSATRPRSFAPLRSPAEAGATTARCARPASPASPPPARMGEAAFPSRRRSARTVTSPMVAPDATLAWASTATCPRVGSAIASPLPQRPLPVGTSMAA